MNPLHLQLIYCPHPSDGAESYILYGLELRPVVLILMAYFGLTLCSAGGVDPFALIVACSFVSPCLFDLDADPFEHNDIAAANPTIVQSLLALFAQATAEYHIPPTTVQDLPGYLKMLSKNTYGGYSYLAPWAQISFFPEIPIANNATHGPVRRRQLRQAHHVEQEGPAHYAAAKSKGHLRM